MKKRLLFICLFFTLYLSEAFSVSVNVVVPGTLSSMLSANQKSTITDMVVTGYIDARDVKTMRDEMSFLSSLDLSNSKIMSYTGMQGTDYSSSSVHYPANEMPVSSFCIKSTNSGKVTLKSLKFPKSIVSIGTQACYSCTGLAGSISIPDSVSLIGGLAFYNCVGVSAFSVGNVVPPVAQYSTFIGVNKNSCVLNVPTDAMATYKTAENWKEFATIKEPLSLIVSYNMGGEVSVNSCLIYDNTKFQIVNDTVITFCFSPNINCKLEGLIYNNEDVLSKVVDNKFTTPVISKNGALIATFGIKQFNLSIINSDGGTTNLICDYGAMPKFNLTPNKEKRIDSVFFNDKDVTSSLKYGIYIVPPITENSTLKVFYSVMTSSDLENTDRLNVYAFNSEIVIDGSAVGEIIRVYTLFGKEIKMVKSDGERIHISLDKGSVYIIRASGRVVKVVL